ncbi:uncharacterized protein METZ01_LOCUS193761 [marine metagenome]|uniref:Uncharacterized protein n=1 Tax=marine metagenome TaxID=408172 RepID=A0A382DTK4_9ZZZZ
MSADTGIKKSCDTIVEKLDEIIPITEKKGQKKRMKKLRKKTLKVRKFYRFAKKNGYL